MEQHIRASAPRLGKQRLIQLEALRGLAALVVLASHYILSFLPSLRLSTSGSPIYWLINGSGAVTLFFTLSGFVLSIGYFLGGDSHKLRQSALKRWPRLLGPVLISILLAWFVLTLKLNANGAAAAISGSSWLKDFANSHFPKGYKPNLVDALQQSVMVFVQGQTSYNSSLWTMRHEFAGSFLTFTLAATLRGLRTSLVSAVLLVAMFVFSFTYVQMIPFVVGLAIAFFFSTRTVPTSWLQTVCLLGVGLLLLCYDRASGMFSPLAKLNKSELLIVGMWVQTIGATCLLVMAINSRVFLKLFGGTTGVWLGRYSFPIYLVQVVVFCTFSSYSFVFFRDWGVVAQLSSAVLATLFGALILATPLVFFEMWWLGIVSRSADLVMPKNLEAQRRADELDGMALPRR